MYKETYKTYLVYCATNKITGHKYVGATDDFERRKIEHRYSEYGGTTLFSKALQYFKFENFVWEILYVSKNKEHIFNEMEGYFIYTLESYVNGYNLQKGDGKWSNLIPSKKNEIIFEIPAYEVNKTDISIGINDTHRDAYIKSEENRKTRIIGKRCGYCGDSTKIEKKGKLLCATCFPGGEFISANKIKKSLKNK